MPDLPSDQSKRKLDPDGYVSTPHGTNGKAHEAVANSTSSVKGRSFSLLATIAVCVAILVFQRTSTHNLPVSYVICSRTGQDIYTVDDANPRVQCMAIHGPQIVAIGSLQEVKEHWGNISAPIGAHATEKISSTLPNIRFIEDGSIIVPGMSDSHAHILEYGASRLMDLEGAKTIADCIAAVRDYVLTNPDVKTDMSRFIEGWGWDHTSWPVEEWPTANVFDDDAVLKGRFIVLQSKDGHALWVSPSVLESSLSFPEKIDGGWIIRDSAGKPSGTFIDNAQELVKRPPLSDLDLEKRFAVTVRDATAHGLTSIHDAGFNPISLEFFKRQAAAAKLPIRIYGMAHFDETGEYWGDKKQPIIDAANGRFNVRSVKIFADGALRSGGAALYEPYADNPTTNGVMRLDADVLNSIIPRFLRDGWQNVHAIGDRANGIVLDAFEAALEGVNVSALRPRLEHAQIMTASDMIRLGQLGVIASVQPTHAISDMWYAQDRLGPERIKSLYAFRTLIDSGARITLGSDFPVESTNPLMGFYAAITRLSPTGSSPHGIEGWFPEQRLTREEALRGITIDPAYASFTESTLGSIIPSKRADYVVLSKNIMIIPPHEILTTKVSATVVDGRPIFGSV